VTWRPVSHSASEDGTIMAAPAPWTARAAISAPSEGASPQATEATVKPGQGGQEERPAAEAVARRAAKQQQAGQRCRVGVHHPLQGRHARPEVLPKRGQGHGDDRRIEDHTEVSRG
jgi:hypothetical protein